MKRKTAKKRKKRYLVNKSKEFVNKEDGFKDVPHSRMKGSGIYALYNNYGLYYVGLSNSSLRSRIRAHARGRRKNNWNKYSWYHIPRVSDVKEIETILLKIINPQGNKVQGRFKKRKK